MRARGWGGSAGRRGPNGAPPRQLVQQPRRPCTHLLLPLRTRTHAHPHACAPRALRPTRADQPLQLHAAPGRARGRGDGQGRGDVCAGAWRRARVGSACAHGVLCAHSARTAACRAPGPGRGLRRCVHAPACLLSSIGLRAHEDPNRLGSALQRTHARKPPHTPNAHTPNAPPAGGLHTQEPVLWVRALAPGRPAPPELPHQGARRVRVTVGLIGQCVASLPLQQWLHTQLYAAFKRKQNSTHAHTHTRPVQDGLEA